MPMTKSSETSTMTVEEFLNWNDNTDTRYELVNGEIMAMSPPVPFHGLIAANLTVVLRQQLQPPCRVILEAGIRSERDDLYYQADLAVGCTPLTAKDRHVPDPMVIVEVLSPSTQSHDRGVKVADYRTIPSVREIVLVSSTVVHVELWRRTLEGWMVLDLIGRDTRFTLESLGVELTLAAIYEGIDFIG